MRSTLVSPHTQVGPAHFPFLRREEGIAASLPRVRSHIFPPSVRNTESRLLLSSSLREPKESFLFSPLSFREGARRYRLSRCAPSFFFFYSRRQIFLSRCSTLFVVDVGLHSSRYSLALRTTPLPPSCSHDGSEAYPSFSLSGTSAGSFSSSLFFMKEEKEKEDSFIKHDLLLLFPFSPSMIERIPSSCSPFSFFFGYLYYFHTTQCLLSLPFFFSSLLRRSG